MKYRVRNFFFGLIVAAVLFTFGRTFWLEAQHRIDFLQALFCMDMSLLSAFWFGFQLNQKAQDSTVEARSAHVPSDDLYTKIEPGGAVNSTGLRGDGKL